MKLFNVYPSKLAMPFGVLSALVLGESGRARKQVIVPSPDAANLDDQYEIALARSGKPKIVQASTPSPGWIARINTQGVYTRGTSGTCRVMSEHEDRIKVLERGYGAYGDAGRLGGWDDLLVTVSAFPTVVRVKPSGGHKIPGYWLVFTADSVTRVTNEQRVLYEEATGIDILLGLDNYNQL